MKYHAGTAPSKLKSTTNLDNMQLIEQLYRNDWIRVSLDIKRHAKTPEIIFFGSDHELQKFKQMSVIQLIEKYSLSSSP